MVVYDKPVEVHASFRFTVNIDGVNQAAFTECKLPALQVETEDIMEGGQNEYIHRLPKRVKAGSITLRHGITKDGALLEWYLQVLSGDIKKATRTVTVVMYDSKLDPIARFTFRNAYPIKWSGPTLKTEGKALAIEELELTHHGFEVQ